MFRLAMASKESTSPVPEFVKDENNHNISKPPRSPVDFSPSETNYREESREAGEILPGDRQPSEMNGHAQESRYVSSPSPKSDSRNEYNDENIHLKSMMSLPHHAMGMLRPEAEAAETTKLLRGILQGREQRLTASLGPEATEENRANRPSSNLINRTPVMRSPSYENDFDSMPSESRDFSDSDLENDRAECESADDESRYDGEESKEKRMKLETIISSMRVSPFKTNQELIAAEARKGKRKQFCPQQHDVATDDEPSPKRGKMEKDVLQKQLSMMQAQLSQMHQRYMQMFEENGHVADEMLSKKLSNGPLTEKYLNEKESGFTKPNPIVGLAESSDLDPSHFFKQASKLVHEQEIASKVSTYANENPQKDLEKLAKMLKQEISNSVGSLVDNIVGKFMESKQRKVKEEEKSKNSQPVHNNNNPSNNNNNINSSQHFAKDKTLSRELSEDKMNNLVVPKPVKTKVTDKLVPPMPERLRNFSENFFSSHPFFGAPPPFFPGVPPALQPFLPKEPEQTEPMALVVNTPKKKRTKVTDTRLSPRAARALLQEGGCGRDELDMKSLPAIPHMPMPLHPPHPFHNPLVPVTLPTSVAIPNPSLQHSDFLSMYSQSAQHHQAPYTPDSRPVNHSPLVGDNGSPNMPHTPDYGLHMTKSEDSMDTSFSNENYDGLQQTSTLTPMHLRKAKLMFFYVRYPSSAIIKIYFPDVKFNKNNTAQLVKWFSNFREFYYIQMEKYARQHIAEGTKSADDIFVTLDSELYRVLNLHYNRNNQIEVPENFRVVVEATLREFYKSISTGKDGEQSWKKAIYKIIARMDDPIPEFFKSSNWMEQLNDL